MTGRPPAALSGRVLLAVAAGGAVGAVLRAALGQVAPDGTGFPWTTFAINVGGSLLLALLPALAARRGPVLVAALGPGVLGGFTTLSATSEQARALLADGSSGTATAYVVGTLAACLLAVHLAFLLVAPADEELFEAEEGDL